MSIRPRLRPLATAVGVFALAVAACARLGWDSLELPPGLHDEYSYLFQAKTHLAGRFWFPSQNAIPGVFDQLHVLNEGRFASRYFPGTGLWLAPFVALGPPFPYLSQWLAAGLAAALVFEAARAIGGARVGLVAGVLVALAPGLADFCNLLVAHAPTLLGLSFFLCGQAHVRRRDASTRAQLAWSAASGAGLAFAMLCRPLTAAAIGLPFGLALVAGLGREIRSLRGATNAAAHRLRPLASAHRRLVATALPIALGLLILAAHDRAITGSVWQTPYGLYNAIYTPRHVYGFDNGVRGDAVVAPKRTVAYDRWARNLTGPGAANNARIRLDRSLRASIGASALVVGLVAIVLGRRRGDSFWLLCATSAATLHLAHVPYWFVGITAYHYVLESIPLYALVFAGSVQVVDSFARDRLAGRARALLVSAWIAIALVPTVWPWLVLTARHDATTGTVLREGTSFRPARLAHARFLARIEAQVRERPALVLIDQPPREIHLDLVVNDPDLNAPVLFGRFVASRMSLGAIANAFPERALYLYNDRTDRLARVGRDGRLHPFPSFPETENISKPVRRGQP